MPGVRCVHGVNEASHYVWYIRPNVRAGGSLLKIMGALAGSKDVDWANWHVFFGDERNVPHSSPDSTIKGAREGFLGKVPIPEANIYAIREGLPVQVRPRRAIQV